MKERLIQVIERVNFIKKVKDGIPPEWVPRILFLCLLGVIYIGSRHRMEKLIREANKLEQRIEDLRANYITLKAEYMMAGKPSEISKRVKKIGLVETLNPPEKIVVQEN